MGKKYLAFLLAIALCFGILAGCSSSSGSGDTGEPVTEGNAWDAAAGKTYSIGTDTTFAPFEFEDENGNHTGIDIQLLDAIAAEMGFTVEWQVLGFTASVTALEASQVDGVMAGMSITEERKLKYDFSDSYYDAGIAVAVAADASYASLEDLRGKTVVAKTGTTGAQYAEKIGPDYELNITYVEDSAIMYTYVTSGQAEACFEDEPIILYEIARGNVAGKVIATSEDSYPTAFAVLKGNNLELISAFNEGLSRLKDSGKYQEILDTYFKAQ